MGVTPTCQEGLCDLKLSVLSWLDVIGLILPNSGFSCKVTPSQSVCFASFIVKRVGCLPVSNTFHTVAKCMHLS